MPPSRIVPVLLLLASGCGPAVALSPAFRAVGPHATPRGDAVFERSGVVVRVREVGGAQRRELLRLEAGLARDPFALEAGPGTPFFRTFVLEIENRGPGEVSFNPSFSSLRVAKERRFPLGYAQLYEYLRRTLPSDEERERLAPLVAETALSVEAGSRTTRILAFERLPPRAREAVLELVGLRFAAQELSLLVRFTRDAKPAP